MLKTSRAPRNRNGEEGVVIVLFSIFLVALLAFGALVYTGAQALVLRRQLQNAGDAAALAAANVLIINGGCSASGSGGPPQAAVVTAAKNEVAANFPSYDLSKVIVTCTTTYENHGVRVQLAGVGPSYFGMNGLNAATVSTAVNGQTVDQDYAVVVLNPSNLSWPSQRSGCASFLINGGITLTFEKKVIVNSMCTVADSQDGAVKAINSSFQMNLLNGAEMRIGGEHALNTTGKINPAPIQNFRPLMNDPLSGLLTPNTYLTNGSGASLPTINMSTSGSGICRGQDPCILPPGTYPGGIAAGGGGAPSTLLLRPGVYYLGGGGFKMKSASARVIGIPDATTMPDNIARASFATTHTQSTIINNWLASCPLNGNSCGTLLYNAPSGSSWVTSGGNADQINNGAQGLLLLRAYEAEDDSIAANRAPFDPYSGLVIWQARLPAPTQASAQPVISMAGGACVIVSGTLYAAGGQVEFGGSTCGTGGGGEAATTLQFIVWDLTLAGNNNFYFAYQKNFFAAPFEYGLVE